jgi:hypothetical protein
MTTVEHTLVLPTPARFEEANDASFAYFDHLEQIINDLRGVLEYVSDRPIDEPMLPDGIVVDAAYVGEFYSFLDAVETDAIELGSQLERLRKLLPEVHQCRLDSEARREFLAKKAEA